MPDYHLFTDIEVRYSDLDAQGHVNNTRFFTFIEHARVQYYTKAGLWDGKNFMDLGLIVADAHMAFLAPIELGQTVRVWIRVERIGNKSLRFEYELVDAGSGQVFGKGDSVMVCYDYHTKQSIPVPVTWREKIAAFEGREQPA